MALFAELDENNVVTQVIVVSNRDTSVMNGLELEEIGIAFCKKLLGADTNWKQTSYNGNMRARYAGIGYTYDEEHDAFIPPKPFDSWILNPETLDWESPFGIPPLLTQEQIDSGSVYRWDEDSYQADNTTGWVLETPEPPAEEPA